MIARLEDLKDGHLYTPAEVAPFFPGRNPIKVRAMCASGELPVVPSEGEKGQARYWISGAAVKAWRRRNEVKAA